MRIAGIIFDLDGTLGDTLAVSFEAFRRTFKEYLDRGYTDEEIFAMFGPSDDGVLQRMLPEGWQAAYASYLDTYDRIHTQYARSFPAVAPALDTLKRRGLEIAVVTAKSAETAAISLRKLGLAGYFDRVEAGSAQGADKPRAIRKVLAEWGVDREQVAYIGDGPHDIRAAHEVGVVALGAAWAAKADAGRLAPLQPAAVFYRVEDFIRWVEENSESGD